MVIFEVAKMAAQEVTAHITGRAADHGISLPYVASMAISAGDGDYVEIGSLFGASAITVALCKKWLGQKGKVVCVDPYLPRATEVVIRTPEAEEFFEGNPDVLMENAKKFGVELELVQKLSQPWPTELDGRTFASGYIDGCHLNDTPWKDFLSLSSCVRNFIGFDNYEEEYTFVVDAFNKAITTTGWRLYYKNFVFAALRRAMPSRTENPQMNLFDL